MFQVNSRQLNKNQKKSSLDHIIWFVENYLPQKKNRASRKELSIDNLEFESIKQIKKLASLRSKSLKNQSDNTKVVFTIGSWALPFLRTLKKIGLFK